MQLVLASSSTRRRELLKNAGFEFEVCPSKVQEVRRQGEIPEDYVRRAAREKALDVAGSRGPGTLVLGADTVVDCDGQILEKPVSPDTGVCLVQAPALVEALDYETTFVTFRQLDEEEVRTYVRSREPFDKAGAYGIQGLASRFVTRISGCYFNVVGLPVPLVYEVLKPYLKG